MKKFLKSELVGIVWLAGILAVGTTMWLYHGAVTSLLGYLVAAAGGSVVMTYVNKISTADGNPYDVEAISIGEPNTLRHRMFERWGKKIQEIQEHPIAEDRLIAAYRKVAMCLQDEMNPRLAEEMGAYTTSEVLNMFEKTPWSFQKFCRDMQM